MKFSMHYDHQCGRWIIYIFREERGYREVLSNGEWHHIENGKILPEFLAIDEAQAKEFFTGIIDIIKDSGFDSTHEDLKATEKHLEDMRAITFHKLGMNK